jgi:hypothetical protein
MRSVPLSRARPTGRRSRLYVSRRAVAAAAAAAGVRGLWGVVAGLGEEEGDDAWAWAWAWDSRERAWASFQPRLTASWMPAFMPCPPAGEWMWAASPATKRRPSRYWF